MKVSNPGDWARESLQLRMDSQEEYDKFRTSLALSKIKVGELAIVNGSAYAAHYLMIEGHQTLVYVPTQENSF